MTPPLLSLLLSRLFCLKSLKPAFTGFGVRSSWRRSPWWSGGMAKLILDEWEGLLYVAEPCSTGVTKLVWVELPRCN